MRAYLSGFRDGFCGCYFDPAALSPYRCGWSHGSRCAGWGWW